MATKSSLGSMFNSFLRSGPIGLFSSASRPAAKSVARKVTPTISRAVSPIKSSFSRSMSSPRSSSLLSGITGLGRSLTNIRPTGGTRSMLSGPLGFSASNASKFIGANRPSSVTRAPKFSVSSAARPRTPSFAFGSGSKGISSAVGSIGKAIGFGGFGGLGSTMARGLSGGAPKTVTPRERAGGGFTAGANKVTNPMSAFGKIIAPVKSFFSGQDTSSAFRGGLNAGPSGLAGGLLGGKNPFNKPGSVRDIKSATGAGQSPDTNFDPYASQKYGYVNVPGTKMYFDANALGKGQGYPDFTYQKNPATGQFDPMSAMAYNTDPTLGAMMSRAIGDYQVSGASQDVDDQGNPIGGYGLDPVGGGPTDLGFTPGPMPGASNPLSQFPLIGDLTNQMQGDGDMASMIDKFQKYKDMYEQGKGAFEQLSSAFGGGGDEGMPDTGALGAAQDAFASQGGQGPLDPLITERLRELLSAQFGELTDEELQAILGDLDESEQKELDFIIDQYKNLRPGADIESDSSYRRDIGEVREKYAKLKQQASAQGRRDVRNQFNDDLLKALSVATGQSENTNQAINDLLSAQMSLKSGNPMSSFSASQFPATILLNT